MTVYFYALFVHLSINIYIFMKGVRLLEEKKTWRAIALPCSYLANCAVSLADGVHLDGVYILPDCLVADYRLSALS
jgi:hypothetical protein